MNAGRSEPSWLGGAAVVSALLTACGAPDPPGSTGGTDATVGRCGRGLVVVSTDYQSTNMSLLSTGGVVR